MKRKRRAIALIAIVAIIIGIVFWRSPKNYKKTYELEHVIEERYDKEKGVYSFSFESNDVEYNLVVKSDYIHKRKLITEMAEGEVGDAYCVLLKSDRLKTYPLCQRDGEFIDYDLLEDTDDYFTRETYQSSKTDYNNITVYDIENRSYLVWNHTGYYFISKDKQEELTLLDHESYYNNLAMRVDNLVITPNYDDEIFFKSFHIIDMKTGKTREWKMDAEISYNSYYLGQKDGIIYLIDRKNKKEYAINPLKRKIEAVDVDGMGKVWNDGWEEVSMTKLVGEDYSFAYSNAFSYAISEKGLVMKTIYSKDEVLVSKREISKLLEVTDDTAYYLVGSEFYSYSPLEGERLLGEYSELNFNDINSIFAY